MCNCCGEKQIFPYRIVQTIYERNSLPCEERVNGMIVTVIGNDLSYRQYILKGGDPCVNTNWKEYNLDITDVKQAIGHESVNTIPEEVITSLYLNTRFPKAIEGFRVTYTLLNTTFMKIFGDSWIMSGNIKIE